MATFVLRAYSFVQITFNKEAIDALNDIFSILYKLIAFRICFSGTNGFLTIMESRFVVVQLKAFQSSLFGCIDD